MTETRIHQTVSSDGTEIAARVHGEGPPVLLVHGAFGDGEAVWSTLLPELTESFTCYAMSTRGRGLSSPGVDPAPVRLIDDVVRMVESIGESTPLFGWSMGGLLAAAIDELQMASAAAPNVDVQLRELAAVFEYDGPSSMDPDELAKVRGPLLLLHGTRSQPGPWFSDGIRHVARHVAHAGVRTIDGAGHFGPVLHPAAVAGEITAFLAAGGHSAG